MIASAGLPRWGPPWSITVNARSTTNGIIAAMPDRRQHRGAHPRDPELFAAGNLPALREAAADYAWLLTRGYAVDSALTLVGNRHALTARQRTAVSRVTCSDAAAARRLARKLAPEDAQGKHLGVDGF